MEKYMKQICIVAKRIKLGSRLTWVGVLDMICLRLWQNDFFQPYNDLQNDFLIIVVGIKETTFMFMGTSHSPWHGQLFIKIVAVTVVPLTFLMEKGVVHVQSTNPQMTVLVWGKKKKAANNDRFSFYLHPSALTLGEFFCVLSGLEHNDGSYPFKHCL